MWPLGIGEWKDVYDRRLQTWLRGMEDAEKSIETTQTKSQFRLSTYMRESWESGRFWLKYAARKSWAFDTIYWKYLDGRSFGDRAEGVEGKDFCKNDLWKSREHLLTEKERMEMEPFVQMKMEELKEKVLINWDLEPEQAKKRLAEVLFDEQWDSRILEHLR